MSRRGSALALGMLVVASVAGVTGCARKEEAPVAQRVAVDAGPRVTAPVDHLAPGELVEGQEKVFALAIPRLMRIDRTFEDVAYVSGPVAPEPVGKYIEARVRDGSVKDTAEGRVFEGVRVAGERRLLRILVERNPVGAGTRVEIRDITPPPPIDPAPDEEGRWRAVGLKPNGEPLDRTQLR